jgi:hypothetical protein
MAVSDQKLFDQAIESEIADRSDRCLTCFVINMLRAGSWKQLGEDERKAFVPIALDNLKKSRRMLSDKELEARLAQLATCVGALVGHSRRLTYAIDTTNTVTTSY